jgi:hypothetical protein
MKKIVFVMINFICFLLLSATSFPETCGCGSDTTATIKPATVTSCCSADPAPAVATQSSRQDSTLSSCGCGAPASPANQKNLVKGTDNPNNDCGVWALAYVAKSLGKSKSEAAMRKLVSFDPNKGATMQELAVGAQKLGLEANGYQMSYTELAKRKLPVIVYIPNHFMVLTAVDAKKNQLTFADSSKKKINMPKDEFLSIWQGYVLEIKKKSS